MYIILVYNNIYIYMSARYFYKGVPLNDLISNGGGGNPTVGQTTTIGAFNFVPGIYTDNKTFSQLTTTGFIDSDGNDIGLRYTAFYETYTTLGSTQIDLVNGPIQKTKYDSISAVLVGGSGGGGGGGGSGFENTPPSGTNSGYKGNGGGGGALSIYNKTSITPYNQLDVWVGTGGDGGSGGISQQNDRGFAGGNGGTGQRSRLLGQNSGGQIILLDANGGEGGYGGIGANASSSAGAANIGQADGGTGTVNGTKGNAATGRTTGGTGGGIGSSSTYPTITSGAGGTAGDGSGLRGIEGSVGSKGSDGSVRIYFFRS